MHDFESAKTHYDASQEYDRHSSIRKYYGKSHLEKLIEREVMNKRDQLIITSTYVSIESASVSHRSTASIESDMQDDIQALIILHLERDVKLRHLTFRSREHQGF